MQKKPTILARAVMAAEIAFLLSTSLVIAAAIGALTRAVSLLP